MGSGDGSGTVGWTSRSDRTIGVLAVIAVQARQVLAVPMPQCLQEADPMQLPVTQFASFRQEGNGDHADWDGQQDQDENESSHRRRSHDLIPRPAATGWPKRQARDQEFLDLATVPEAQLLRRSRASFRTRTPERVLIRSPQAQIEPAPKDFWNLPLTRSTILAARGTVPPQLPSIRAAKLLASCSSDC